MSLQCCEGQTTARPECEWEFPKRSRSEGPLIKWHSSTNAWQPWAFEQGIPVPKARMLEEGLKTIVTVRSSDKASHLQLTSNDFPRSQRIPDMYIWLRNLGEDQQNLDDLHFCVVRWIPTVSHHVEEGCRERVQETLTDEHTAEVVLRCWALQFEHTSNSIQSVFDELGLFTVILVKEIDQNF